MHFNHHQTSSALIKCGLSVKLRALFSGQLQYCSTGYSRLTQLFCMAPRFRKRGSKFPATIENPLSRNTPSPFYKMHLNRKTSSAFLRPATLPGVFASNANILHGASFLFVSSVVLSRRVLLAESQDCRKVSFAPLAPHGRCARSEHPRSVWRLPVFQHPFQRPVVAGHEDR